jgi:vacuolar-type H+-ATPase subunit E/Vma4
MKIVDNREYLLNEIHESAEHEVKKLKDHFEQNKEQLISDYEDRIQNLEHEMEERHTKDLERIKKQRQSNFELQSRKQIVDKESEIYEKVIQSLYEYVKKAKAREKKRIFERIAQMIEEKSTKKIKEFRTPKGIKLKNKNCKDTLKELTIIAVVSKDEEYEISFEELIQKHNLEIHELIKKEYVGE